MLSVASADSWRFMIPALLDLGLRLIVPDMIGYGQTVRGFDPRQSSANVWLGHALDRSWPILCPLRLEIDRGRHGGAASSIADSKGDTAWPRLVRICFLSALFHG